MALNSKIAEGIVYLTFRGYVTAEDIRDMVDLLAKIETEARVSPDRVADLTAIEGMSLNFSAIIDYSVMRRKAPLKNKVKAAIVAPHPLQYGFARMFQTLNDNPDINMEIFTDKNSGLAWISAGKSGDSHKACPGRERFNFG
ncbi:MAG TPA: hypothetical protein VKS19_02115 [Verrucomicrobiae bacterium]|nr:hypothetical protein [Verrucomicrobiae bacterium]